MRFWIDRSSLKKDTFLIEGDLHHHICRVSGIKKGESFELFCEGLQKYKVCLIETSSKKAKAKIQEIFEVPALKKPYLNLACSLPRLNKLDKVIEKAVELGVKKFQPFVSDLSYFKSVEKIPEKRRLRWQKITEQALALSGRSEGLEILPPLLLEDIKLPKKDLCLLAYEGEKSSSLKNILKDNPSPSDIWLFIGSEGGFSKKEVDQFCLNNQVKSVSFGDQILRVETACLFGLSLLKYHYHL